MSVFAISDLHLSTFEKTNKSMEVFGHRWDNYMDRIKSNWERLVTDRDTVIIPGDISWALSLDEATSDLKFIDSLPGKKIFAKGNHDFWWATIKKNTEHFEKHGIKSVSFLFNNAHETDDFIIAGTRGWYHDEEAQSTQNNADFDKLTKREALRLEASIKYASSLRDAGGTDKEIVVFMHFPPFWGGKESENIMAVLEKYGIKRVFFGHIHGSYTTEPTFIYKGINMSIIAADYLNFIPKHIPK